MTTITALNVRLGMDVSNFSDGANLAKNEVTKVATIMRQSVPPAEKYKQELDLLNRAFSEAGKQSAQYAIAVEFLNKKHQQGKHSIEQLAKEEQKHLTVLEKGKALTLSVEKAQEAHNRRIREYSSLLRSGAIDQETFRRAMERSNKTMKESQAASTIALSSLKGLAAAYLGVQTIAKSINLASQVEDATIAFEVLTGSAKDGQLLFEQIRKFAAESPVTFSGAGQAAKTLMSFNVAAQDVLPTLQMLSDVTGGNNERFKMMSLAFAQMSAAGRLMGQDLLQMINAGFNPLQEMAKKLAAEFGGLAADYMPQLKKQMEDGAISTEMVRDAFESATAVGGMFHGMTERLAQTVSGKLNIALSDMEQKLAAAGQAMGPIIIILLDAFTQVKPLLDAIIWVIDKISRGLEYMVAIAKDLISTVSTFTLDTTATDKYLDDLEKRNRKAAEAANQQIQHEFEQRLNGVDEVKAAQMRAAREAEAARLKAIEEQKKAAEAAWKEQQKNIEKENKARLKAAMDWHKAQQRAARQAEEAFQKELADARKDAMKFFEDKKKENDKRREDVAKGPGTGMEVGSAESVKFAADAVNAGIAKLAVPEEIVLNRDITRKTAELLIAQREANALAKDQLEVAKKHLKEMQENGFRRLR